jgi:hypothetical protein
MHPFPDLDDDLQALAASCAEPVIAGTLCLMSAAMHSQSPRAMLKIERNLELLSRHPGVTPNFRVICSRLARQWCARARGLLDADGDAAGENDAGRVARAGPQPGRAH